MLEKKRPFVYELGGELYLIGMNVCEKLFDVECRSFYGDYRSAYNAAADSLCRKYGLADGLERLGNYEWEHLSIRHQRKIGIALGKLETCCFLLSVDREPDDDDRRLNLELEKKYGLDVEKQREMWDRADDYRTLNCATRLR